MTNPIADISLRQAAIVAGGAILIMAIAAVVATDLTIGNLIVPGDAAAVPQAALIALQGLRDKGQVQPG